LSDRLDRIARLVEGWTDPSSSNPRFDHITVQSGQVNDVLLREQWKYVGVGNNPAFQNSWVNYGSNQTPARFLKDASGVVHVEGVVKSGGLNTIFTLPVGYRTEYQHGIPTDSNAGNARIVLTYDGTVTLQSGGTAWLDMVFSFYVG